MWSCFISHFVWCLQCHVLLDPNEDLWEWLRWFLYPRYSRTTNYPPPCPESKTESITKTYTWRLCIFFLGWGGGGGLYTNQWTQIPGYMYHSMKHINKFPTCTHSSWPLESQVWLGEVQFPSSFTEYIINTNETASLFKTSGSSKVNNHMYFGISSWNEPASLFKTVLEVQRVIITHILWSQAGNCFTNSWIEQTLIM